MYTSGLDGTPQTGVVGTHCKDPPLGKSGSGDIGVGTHGHYLLRRFY